MIRIFSTLLFTIASFSAHAAFEFSPIITMLAPSGPGATSSFTVSNTGDTKIPVQVSIVAREPDESGKEVYIETEAISEMFRIFPGQLVLNPKETRTVRITYVGTPKVKSELAFRVIAEELPVDVSDPKKVYKKAVANVTIAIKYVGSVYVTPPGAKSELQIEAIPEQAGDRKPAEKKNDGPQNLILTVTNKGTTHQVVRKPILRLKSSIDNTEVVMQPTELPTLSNLNILAGKTRKFVVTWPKNLPIGAVKASFDSDKE